MDCKLEVDWSLRKFDGEGVKFFKGSPNSVFSYSNKYKENSVTL